MSSVFVHVRNFFTRSAIKCECCGKRVDLDRMHKTMLSESVGCFTLCEECWSWLGSPYARTPYYWQWWLREYATSNNPVRWGMVRRAILSEADECTACGHLNYRPFICCLLGYKVDFKHLSNRHCVTVPAEPDKCRPERDFTDSTRLEVVEEVSI